MVNRLALLCLLGAAFLAGCSSNDAANAGNPSSNDTTATASHGKMPSGQGDGTAPNTPQTNGGTTG